MCCGEAPTCALDWRQLGTARGVTREQPVSAHEGTCGSQCNVYSKCLQYSASRHQWESATGHPWRTHAGLPDHLRATIPSTQFCICPGGGPVAQSVTSVHFQLVMQLISLLRFVYVEAETQAPEPTTDTDKASTQPPSAGDQDTLTFRKSQGAVGARHRDTEEAAGEPVPKPRADTQGSLDPYRSQRKMPNRTSEEAVG